MTFPTHVSIPDLDAFIRESNRIEGIKGDPSPEEYTAYMALLTQPELFVADMQAFVTAIQPGAVLRDKHGLDVCVGNYIAPRGGPEIKLALEGILAASWANGPWDQHIAYERLHPFTDGNGRSGRALWLWNRKGYAPLGFLHSFYYQTLEAMP